MTIKQVNKVAGFKFLTNVLSSGRPAVAAPWERIDFDDRYMLVGGTAGNDATGDSHLSESLTRSAAQLWHGLGQPFLIDIESWTTSIAANFNNARASIDRLLKIIAWARDEVPTMPIGIYGIAPVGAFVPAVSIDSTYTSWVSDSYYLKTLADACDFICPSWYVAYSNPNEFERFASRFMDQARTYGKPVFPFIWYKYHQSAVSPAVAGQYIGDTYWKTILQTCLQLADGLVLFTESTDTWDGNAAWWTIANAFATRIAALQAYIPTADNGDGDVIVNHHTGGTDHLRYTFSNGAGADQVNIKAYLKSEYDAGIFTERGKTYTGSDGRWVLPMLLNSGMTYYLVGRIPGVTQVSMTEITV